MARIGRDHNRARRTLRPDRSARTAVCSRCRSGSAQPRLYAAFRRLALLMIGGHGSAWNASRTFGDAAFLMAGFLTACFTLIMRQAKLDPLHAAALVSTGSLVIYAPLYFALRGTRLVQVPLADVGVQVFFQGVVVSIVALVLYGRVVAILGASGGSAFGALVPALSALFAVPLVGDGRT